MESFLLRDHEDNYAPPEQPCLRVAVVGDVLFLEIVKHDETNEQITETNLYTIGVHYDDFARGLIAAAENNAAHQARRKD